MKMDEFIKNAIEAGFTKTEAKFLAEYYEIIFPEDEEEEQEE
jgi:hypothetical protein